MIQHADVLTADWDAEAHEHCRCGARLLPVVLSSMPPIYTHQCARCLDLVDACRCRDRCCESCGWGPS